MYNCHAPRSSQLSLSRAESGDEWLEWIVVISRTYLSVLVVIEVPMSSENTDFGDLESDDSSSWEDVDEMVGLDDENEVPCHSLFMNSLVSKLLII